jgi:hypothetical protein
MKRFAINGLLLLCGLGFPATCIRVQAQGISPVIQEFNKKTRGAVQVNNGGNTAKIVSCRAQSFDPDEHGALRLRPIDAALHVRIAAERVVLQPNGSRQVSFDANPSVLPAWFLVTCAFVPVERGPGITVALEISSVVIVHGGAFDINDVTLSAKHTGAKAEVEVKNNGSGLVRVSSGEVHGHGKQADLGTFILFPHQKRLVESDWKGTAPPETARIQIGKKRLQAPVN